MISDFVKNIVAVGTGSFFGGIARYLVSLAMKGSAKGFPWGTLTVNLLGCFLIGLLWGAFSRLSGEGNHWTLLLTVGFCGGFTTFSTFSKEALLLMQGGNVWGCIAYVAVSVVVGIALVAAGYFLVR